MKIKRLTAVALTAVLLLSSSNTAAFAKTSTKKTPVKTVTKKAPKKLTPAQAEASLKKYFGKDAKYYDFSCDGYVRTKSTKKLYYEVNAAAQYGSYNVTFFAVDLYTGKVYFQDDLGGYDDFDHYDLKMKKAS